MNVSDGVSGGVSTCDGASISVDVIPGVGAHDTIIVDRDGSETRWFVCCVLL